MKLRNVKNFYFLTALYMNWYSTTSADNRVTKSNSF